MPERIVTGLAAIGFLSDSTSPLTRESSMDDIHAYATAVEQAYGGLFNMPRVVEYGDKLLEELEEEEISIKGVDDNDIPIIINKPKGSTPGQAILYIHGGGMAVMSARDAGFRVWARLLARDGLLVAAVDFRNCSGASTRDPFPAGLNDCVSALKWLADRDDIDGVTVHGESGGGNLTLATCVRAAREGVTNDKLAGAVPWAPSIAGPAHWDNWEEDEYRSLRDNNGAGISADQLVFFASTYTPNEEDWKTGEAWPTFMTDEEIALLPPVSLHTNDLDTLRDEAVAFSRRLARAGKLVGHVNHIGTTHTVHLYTPMFNAADISELAAKSVTAFASRAC